MILEELLSAFQEQIDNGISDRFFYELETNGSETTAGIVTLIHHKQLETFLDVANTFDFIGKNNSVNGIVPRFKVKHST